MASRKEYEMMFQLQAQLGSAFNSTFGNAQKQLASMQQEIQALNRVQGDISAYQKQQQAVEATKNKLETLKQQYDNIQQEIKETEGFSSSLENKLLSKQQQIDKTSASLEKETEKLHQMDGALQEAGVDTSNLGNESAALSAKIEELKHEQEQAAESAEEFGESGANAAEAVSEALAAAGIAVALKEIFEAYKECVMIAADFEETLSTVEALSGASASEMDSLSDKAKELGATTKFTAIESGEAMTYMAMAGWDANQMLSGMDGVLQLAAASGEDLAMVSDIVTDNLTAFGMQASETAHFSDVLAAAATNSNTSVSIMGETFKNSAAIAGALGYSVEDVAVAVGLMANAGIKGSLAGTALKNTFNGLLEGATLTAGAFGEVEYSTVNADGTMKDFGTTINELRGYFDQMTDAERVNNAMTLAGQRGYNGLLAIVNATDEDFGSLTQSINECSGAAQKMADIKMDNFKGQLTLMNSAADALKTTLGEQFRAELRGLAKAATEGLNILNAFAKTFPGLSKGITTFIAIIGAAAAGLTAYAAIAKAAAAATALFSASLPGVGAIMGVVTAGAALAGVLVSIANAAKTEDEEIAELTATSREHYYEMKNLEAEYAAVCRAQGETSEEAIALKSRLAEVTQEFEGSKSTFADFSDSLHETSTRLAEISNEYQEAVSGVDQESASVNSLIGRLQKLVEADDGAASSQAEILEIIRQLNGEFPTLNLNYSELINNTSGTMEALRALASQEVKIKKTETAWKAYTDAMGTATTAEENVTKAEKELSAAQERLNSLLERNAELEAKDTRGELIDPNEVSELTDMGVAIYEARMALSDYEEALASANDEQERAEQSAQGYLEKWMEASGLTLETAEATDKLSSALVNTSNQLMLLQNAYAETYDEALKSFEGQFGLFDEASVDAEATVANMQAALDSQLKFWQDYSANVDTLRSVTAEDLQMSEKEYAEFRENYQAIVDLASEGSEEAAGLAASMAQAVKEGKTETIVNLAETLSEVNKAQKAAADSVGKWKTDFDAKMAEIIQTAQKSVDDLDLSPEATAAGQKTINAYAEAIRNNQAQAVAAAKQLAQAVKTAIENVHPVIRVTVTKEGVVQEHYASGTENAARGFALVGERGPEIIYFSGGEQVIPADETKQLLSTYRELNAISKATLENSSGEIVAPFMTTAALGYAASSSATHSRTEAAMAAPTEIRESPITIHIPITVTGNADSDTVARLEKVGDKLRQIVRDELEEITADSKRSAYI